MAQRPVYIPVNEKYLFVKTELIDFTWFPGMSVSQKQKSIDSLHEAVKKICQMLTRFLRFPASRVTVSVLR